MMVCWINRFRVHLRFNKQELTEEEEEEENDEEFEEEPVEKNKLLV